ncbi:MAG TPA: hypothetical protein VIR63_01675 [Pontiella sp.]
MIPISVSADQQVEESWRNHLREIFHSLDIPPGHLADSIAASVAMYCREFCSHGVQHSDLMLLVARAFCSVSEQAAAERILKSMQPHGRHVERWLEILSELHHFPALLPYFSLGIIRPADWVGAQLDRMWILDFERLQLSESERHEMVLYRSVRTIVEHMFMFWDSTAGEGVLGLKGLATLKVSENKRSGYTLTTAEDLLKYVSGLFRQRQDLHGWSAVPTLLNLEL